MIFRKNDYFIDYSENILDEDCLYFDIETTGLQKKNALIYLIGCASRETDGCLRVRQWFAENPDEEALILNEFSEYCKSFPVVCHFNGDRFDVPFFAFRCEVHGLESPLSGKDSRDLYTLLKPCRKILGLSAMRQRDLEDFLGIRRMDTLSGRDCVLLYRELIKYRDIHRCEPLLLHNLEDLLGLAAAESMTAYLAAWEGNFSLHSAALVRDQLTGTLITDRPFPVSHTLRSADITLHFCGNRIEASIPLENGLLKNRYPDYKNYYYLPEEDIAVHRSVGRYVDRSRRRTASLENCYTKFPPSEKFLSDRGETERYFQNNLPLLLRLLRQ